MSRADLARAALGLIAAASLGIGCSNSEGPAGSGGTPSPSPFVVSNPVPAPPFAAAGVARSGPGAATVAYVSLPPGAIPDGRTVTIQDSRLGSSVTTAVVNGGFDPVAVPTASGDTLAVTVQVGGIGGQVSYTCAVPDAEPPIVVRTSPPPHKRDVPLNASIVVVFSQPMDSASLSSAVRLTLGGLPVPGSVIIPANNGAILRAIFAPDTLLARLTTYLLQVDTSALAREGGNLAAPIQVDFTTDTLVADTTAPIVTILSPAPGATLPVDFPQFVVRVQDNRDQGELYCELIDNTTGESPKAIWDPVCHAGTYLQNVNVQPAPGTRTLWITATDAAGNIGASVPVTMTFAEPDTQPRIVVRSFSVLEYTFSSAPDTWIYAPRLTVADAPGESGLEILGLEFLSMPGFNMAGFGWKVFANHLTVPPGQDTPLIGAIYGEYELQFSAADGHRAPLGGALTARLTYRDGTGRLFATTIKGPIVAGAPAPDANSACHHWELPGEYVDDCGTPSQAAR